ncbi:hypothetical protein TI01_1071 [Lysobacter sp. A03]|nr:hypothetical protein TI01_1071 [Lysobacter sp. A03]
MRQVRLPLNHLNFDLIVDFLEYPNAVTKLLFDGLLDFYENVINLKRA